MNFDGPVRVAENVGSGIAQITLSFDAWTDTTVAPTTHLVNVLPPKAGPKAEAVASNLIASLINREGKSSIGQVAFSPDGTRLFTSSYPSGLVQIWDVASKNEIRRFETPPGGRPSDEYALLTADWKTLYVPVQKYSVMSVERDGKRHEQIEMAGQIRVWDVASGTEKDPLQPAARSAPTYAKIAPGGRFLICLEEASYVSGDTPNGVTVLWDLATGQRSILSKRPALPSFFPDGRTVALKVYNADSSTKTVTLVDLATGKELASVIFPISDGLPSIGPVAPDGKVLAVFLAGSRKVAPLEVWFLDGKTLEERGKLIGKGTPERYGRGTGLFTSDGKHFIALDGVGNALVWDVAGRKLERTIPVGDGTAWRMAISPDGKTLAVGWRPKGDPGEEDLRDPEPQDLPQPRVTIISLNGSAAPRVLFAPFGSVGALAFSPDGKTLAFGGTGAVHLFDLSGQQKKSDPPLAAQFEKLKAAMDKVFDDSEKGISDAKSEEEKQTFFEKMRETINRQGTPLVEKALDLVAPRVKDPAAVEILVWIVNSMPASPAAVKAADMLIQYHLVHPKTLDIASRYAQAAMPWTEKVLRALAGADMPAEKKGQALFLLAQCLQTEADFVPRLKKFDARKATQAELHFGKEHLAKLRARDPAKLEAEVVKLLTEVADKYGDESYGRKKLRDVAKAAIYEILNLAIGKTAPEIAGEDIDGKAMKLSDYRGKVVVLDFWGHW